MGASMNRSRRAESSTASGPALFRGTRHDTMGGDDA